MYKRLNHKIMARKKDLSKYKKIICNNPECGKEFYIIPSKTRNYCSQQCAQKMKSINKEWIDKRKQTCLNKYGEEVAFKSKQVQETYKKNLIKKYGVSNPFLIKEVKDKAKKKIIEKYGVEYATQNTEISKKLSQKLKGLKKDRTNFVILKWEKIKNYCENQNLEPLFDSELLLNNFLKNIKFKCKKCQTITEISIDCGYLPTCHKCSHYKGYSLIEDEITRFIQENYKEEIILKSRNLLSSNREIDIFLPNKNLAIEINGIYWHSEIWGKYKNYHLSKTEELLGKNIELFHIFDYEWLYKKPIIQSMILNKLNLTPNKIYARKCKIKEVNFKEKSKFLNDNHLQGECASKINLGLYYDDQLVSIMTFGKNRFKNDNSIELIRFCNILNTNVIGAASKLFKYFIKHYNPQNIITFADRRYSLGNLYNKLGFEFYSFTSPSYFYWKSMKIYNRINFQKHMLKNKLENFDPNLSEYENMLKNGYNRVWDCGNYKFIFKLNNYN